MKFLSEIHRREFTAQRASVRSNFTGLRSYQLSRILPRSAVEDVFLGFSVCGQFLISFKMDFKRFLLRFWFFPPQSSVPGSNETKLQLFAEAPFFHITYVSRFQDTPCVRFIQSNLDSTSFLLLSCDSDGNGLVTAYGSMPNVDCESCMNAHLSLIGSPSANAEASPSCSVHLQVLLLNLDLPSMTDRVPCVFDQSADLDCVVPTNELRPSGDDTEASQDYIPPCLQPYGSTQYCGGGGAAGWTVQDAERRVVSTSCTCFASTPWPIGGIQVSVCTRTGALRLAWVSPDAQIKVISCVFESERQGSTAVPRVRVYPQGTAYDPRGCVAPFAFKAPLLTQNYCSRCYSWPARDSGPCSSSKSLALAPSRLVPSECIFRQIPSCIYHVTDPDCWPDNHRNPELPQHHSRHECVQSKPSYVSKLKSSTWLLDNTVSKSLPAFLHHRPVFTCCVPLTYLAMMEDIRASYIHWTLISRVPWTSTGATTTTVSMNINTDLMEYPRNADLTDDDTAFSVGSRSSQDDEDQLALISSPISADETQSPGDLLVHRLSGQCHTSFDLTAWQEVDGNPVTNLSSSAGSMMSDGGRVTAHLEEVVFDIPLDQENMDWPRSSSSSSLSTSQIEDDPAILSVFSPTDEPDLLLIYQIRHVTRATDSSKPTCSTVRLFGAIDLTTGERVTLHNGQRFWESDKPVQSGGSLLLTLNATRLKQLTTHCPHNRGMDSARVHPYLVHELNNFHMTSRLESVKLLVDPQGGYAVYW